MKIHHGKTHLFLEDPTNVYIDEATGDIDFKESGRGTTTVSGATNLQLLIAASNYLIRLSNQDLPKCDRDILDEMIVKIKANKFLNSGHKIETLYPVTPGEVADRKAWEATVEEGVDNYNAEQVAVMTEEELAAMGSTEVF